MELKKPSPIFSTFFQTFGDFAIARKLIFFSYAHGKFNSGKVFCLEDIIYENVSG